MRPTLDEGEPALTSLLKNVVEGLGTLVAGHVRLARAELEAGAKSYGRHLGLFAIAGAFVLLGYALACVAAGLALTPVFGAPLAFLAIGGVHLLGSGVAVIVLLRRVSPPPLGETLSEIDQTLGMLSADARIVKRAIEAPANGHSEPDRVGSRGVA